MQHPRAVTTRRALVLAGVLAVGVLTPALRADAHDGPVESVIVRSSGSTVALRAEVEAVGGRVETELGLIGAVRASVPVSSLDQLRGSPGIQEVTRDGRVTLLGGTTDAAWRADRDLGSLFNAERSANVDDVWGKKDALGRRITGKGVGVALIDSGVSPVPGLDDDGLVHGPDLSFESQAPNLRNLDTFGHGTHMA